jgi:CubicO group peptidase (beta-lactamase class C family)
LEPCQPTELFALTRTNESRKNHNSQKKGYPQRRFERDKLAREYRNSQETTMGSVRLLPIAGIAAATGLVVIAGSSLTTPMTLELATAPAPGDLAPLLRPLAEENHLPGMVGAIVKGGQIIAIGSTGVRKVGDPAPFLTSDSIHLGSDTKAMTAILVGQLIDRKQIGFDTTMAEIFPDLAPKFNPAMAKVTVRNLLDHDAGLPHDIDWDALDASGGSLPAQRRKAVQRAFSVPPATPIGSFSYSNVSFVLLGAIVEAKTGMAWEKVIEQQIFRPLHMDSAGFGPPGTRGKVDQPWGHILENGKIKALQIDNRPVLGPAGTVHCSIIDWSKFIAEVLRAAQGQPTLVSVQTFKELTTPIPGQNYAGGWLVLDRSWAGGLALTHAGSNTTWYCVAWLAPHKDFAVLIATNYFADSVPAIADKAIGVEIKAVTP